MGKKKQRGRNKEDSADVLKGILAPVAEQIAAAHLQCNGIVVVVHKPGKVARQAMEKIGLPCSSGGTTVAGVSCVDAVAAFGHDTITRRWVAVAPKEDEIKVFLVSGNGTALLTLQFRDGQVFVTKQSDLHAVD